ncbi:MAG: DoxX family protein [Actinobacteria bacterium]|nr:DoxX family protein [Actinomycetota bacterium]
MDWVLLLGRLLFAFLFLNAGFGFHLRQRSMAIGYAKAMGAPAPELTVVLTGLQIIVAGVLIVLGIWVDLAALLVIAFLVPTNYWMHAFWKMDDPDQKVMNRTHFWKNTALIGGALILFYLYQQFGDDTGLNLGPPSLFG